MTSTTAIAASTAIRVASGRVGRGGVQVPGPLAVPDQLGERPGLGEELVDLVDGGVLVRGPQRPQPRAQRSDRLQLGLVVTAASRSSPTP